MQRIRRRFHSDFRERQRCIPTPHNYEREGTFRCRKWSTVLGLENTAKQLQRGLILLLRRHIQAGKKISRVHKVENVRDGHFSVVAAGNGKPKKFFVNLRYLTHPQFLKLLEAAEREFGFNQTGVLVVPCEASELQRILSRKHLD